MPHLDPWAWLVAVVAAVCMGLSKTGFAGMGLVAVAAFAQFFGARDSTGVVLPLFIVGDVAAVVAFRQHTRWDYLARTLVPAGAGVVLGALAMRRFDNASFRPVIGGVLLVLAVLQIVRLRWPDVFGRLPHARPVAWTLGVLAGMTTMMANAAGPLVALFYIAVDLPKIEVVGTLAWFFLAINLFKVPFSASLGLIHGSSLLFNLALAPAVAAGILLGRWLIHRVSQRLFEMLMAGFAALGAVRLLW